MDQKKRHETRPYVEEQESPIVVLYQFTDNITQHELERRTSTILEGIAKEDIGVATTDIRSKNGSYVCICLTSTNINYKVMRTLKRAAEPAGNVQDIIISTVAPEDIVRLDIEKENG